MEIANFHPLIVIVTGGVGLAIACLLWALRISQTAQGIQGEYRRRTYSLERKLARADSVLAAHPGVIMVWDSTYGSDSEWGMPKIYGSPMALATMLSFTDDSSSLNTAERILEGIGDLEAKPSSGDPTSLRREIHKLRDEGTAFSLTVIAPSGKFLEADGRVAGSRLVLWLTDSTIKELSVSKARVSLEETKQFFDGQEKPLLEILDKADIPIWRLNGSGKVQWANAAYLKAVDAKSPAQIIGKEVLLDRKIAALSKQALAERAEISSSLPITIAGERRTMRVVTFPVYGGLGGFALDTTREEILRERFKRHVQSHDQTLNHVADAVAIFDGSHRLCFHNRAFDEMWELDPAFLLENPDHGLLLDRLRENGKLPARTNYAVWRAGELSCYRGKLGENMAEDLWSLPDGRTLRLTRQLHPMGGLLLLFRDITSELDLKARYASLLKVQSATLDNLQAVAVFGSDGSLKLCNENFQTLWEIDPRLTSPGADFDNIATACSALFPDKTLWAAIKARVTDPGPEARQKFDGEMNRSDNRIVSFFTQPLPDGATLIAFKDESDARRSEELLRERANAFQAADQLKTEFVRNVSRELRSPLTTILGYSEMLQKMGSMPDKMSKQVQFINIAADQLSQLVTNILDLAMIDAGHMQLDITEFDIAKIIGESISMTISEAADTEVSIDIKCPADIGSIRADEKRVRQILFNLLTNALHFTGAGDTITVEAEKTDGVFCLKVSDTGCGVPHDRQVLAFSAFDSNSKEGAGLGLALVESFVRLHGGWVAMQSEPGVGTTVLCFLPENAEPYNAKITKQQDRAAA